MEEVPPTPLNPGQFPNELPEPLAVPNDPSRYSERSVSQPIRPQSPRPMQPLGTPNRQPLSIPNYQNENNPNNLPNPDQTMQTVTPETTLPRGSTEPRETDFDKRNERLREEMNPHDEEIMAAGMVALGDVLKNRQPPQPDYGPTGSQPTAPPLPPYSQPVPLPTPVSPVSTTLVMPLYKQAIAIGIIAALIISPLIIYLLIHH